MKPGTSSPTLFRLMCLILAVAAVCPRILHADPFTEPKRMVSGKTVDLTPLFQWRKRHEAERPLPAWVRLTGTVVGTNAYGWIVKAQVEGASEKRRAKKNAAERTSDRVILMNAPAREYADFLLLQARMRSLTAERSSLSNQEANASNRAAEATGKQRHRRSRRASIRAAEAHRTEMDARRELKTVDKEIEAVKKELGHFPSADHYQVDCFALNTSRSHAGMRIYDRGMPLR